MAHFRKYKTSKGEIRHRAEVRLNGAKPISKTFIRKTDAVLWAREQEEKSQRLGAGIQSHRQYTVAEAIERYFNDHLSGLKSRESSVSILGWWKKEIGARYLNTIQPTELVTLRMKIAREPKCGACSGAKKHSPLYNPNGTPIFKQPKTIQNYMNTLSHLYNIAMREWGWSDRNPVQREVVPKYRTVS